MHECLIAAASGRPDRRLVDDLHAVADDYARRMHTAAPGDLLPQIERHPGYVHSMLRGGRPDGHGTGTSMPLDLLEEAHAATSGSSSPWLRVWLTVCRAKEHAIRGDARAALRDLEEADRFLAADASADNPLFAHWRESPVAHVVAYRGDCLQLLGRTGEAKAVIEDAIAGLSPSAPASTSSPSSSQG